MHHAKVTQSQAAAEELGFLISRAHLNLRRWGCLWSCCKQPFERCPTTSEAKEEPPLSTDYLAVSWRGDGLSHLAVGGWFLHVLTGAAEMRGQGKNNADVSDYGGRQNLQEHGIFPYLLEYV